MSSALFRDTKIIPSVWRSILQQETILLGSSAPMRVVALVHLGANGIAVGDVPWVNFSCSGPEPNLNPKPQGFQTCTPRVATLG